MRCYFWSLLISTDMREDYQSLALSDFASIPLFSVQILSPDLRLATLLGIPLDTRRVS
jgi:hypothetical protein